MSLLSFPCCLHPAALWMNSHCQGHGLAVSHPSSDPLRRVRFTAGTYCIWYDWWLLIGTAQARLAVPSIYRWTFNSIVISACFRLALLLQFRKSVVTVIQGRLVVKAAKAAAYPVYHLLIFFLRSKIFLPILVFHTIIDNIFFEKSNFCTKNGNT